MKYSLICSAGNCRGGQCNIYIYIVHIIVHSIRVHTCARLHLLRALVNLYLYKKKKLYNKRVENPEPYDFSTPSLFPRIVFETRICRTEYRVVYIR